MLAARPLYKGVVLGRSGSSWVWLIAACAFVGEAAAQTAFQQIEARLQATEEGYRSLAPAAPPPARVPFTSQRPPSNAEEIRFVLGAVEFSGAQAFPPERLQELVAGDIGREVTLARIFEIAATVQALYRDSDMIFTRIVVPAQTIENGAVRLEVIEAKIDAIVVEEPSGPVGPMRSLAERMVQGLIGVENPTGAQLERTVLNINELPGVFRATVVPQPSGPESRGGLTLYLNIERDPVEGVLYVDNRQTPAIGRGVGGGTITWNSWSAWADTTSVSLFNAFDIFSDKVPETGETDGPGDFDERTTVLVAHQRALGTSGLTGRATALYSRTRPGDDLTSIGIEGDQMQASLEVFYPLLRARQYELGAAVAFEYLDSETDISNGLFQITDDRLRVASARLEGLRRDQFGYTAFETSLRLGLDVLDATPDDQPERSRFDGRSEFTLLRGEVERLLLVNEDLSAYLRVGGQYAFDPLLASEEFSIGGITYGRGFDPSEFTGDHGLGVAAELRHRLDPLLEDFEISGEGYGFVDYGVVWNRGVGEPSRETLLSAGAGVRFFLQDGLHIAAELAKPVNQPLRRVGRSGAPISGERFFLTVTKRF